MQVHNLHLLFCASHLFSSDRDERINGIISECSKLAQEYNTSHGRVGQMNRREKFKKFEFGHTNKWKIHNPAAVPENDGHKLLWGLGFEKTM